MVPLAAMMLAACVGAGCAKGTASAPRPIIRVGVGMTLAQLRSGSTYPFKDSPLTVAPTPELKVKYPDSGPWYNWVITEPYDLVLVCDGHVLKRDDMGADHYLTAISTGNAIPARVQLVTISFQNTPLTLDEALAEAEKLNKWFVQAGFHEAPKPDGLSKFMVTKQEDGAQKYRVKIASYNDLRKAFLDTHARIIDVSIFTLETADQGVSLNITNSRRFLASGSRDRYNTDESHVKTERRYELQLGLGAHPIDRYDSQSQRAVTKQALEWSHAHLRQPKPSDRVQRSGGGK